MSGEPTKELQQPQKKGVAEDITLQPIPTRSVTGDSIAGSNFSEKRTIESIDPPDVRLHNQQQESQKTQSSLQRDRESHRVALTLTSLAFIVCLIGCFVGDPDQKVWARTLVAGGVGALINHVYEKK